MFKSTVFLKTILISTQEHQLSSHFRTLFYILQMMYQQAPQQYNMYGQPIAPGYNMPPQSMYAPAGYPGPGIPGYPQYPQMRGMAPNPMFYGKCYCC